MATKERIIPAVIAEDGSVHYSSVTSPPDDSIAVCYMVPSRIIPVIFVPGIMGTNLMEPSTEKVSWLADSTWSIVKDWGGRGPKKRKEGLDPNITGVFSDGNIPSGTKQTEKELRRRGWGEVANMSYGEFLVWLENALNDADETTDYGRQGLRASLMQQVLAEDLKVTPLGYDEVALSYKYQFPVHAVGYNWLQSNAVSAERLESKIQEFMAHYHGKSYRCSHVILVTHSMGGLVARHYSELMSGNKNVLGIVHGVMPATGSATAYKRVKAGVAMPEGLVVGRNAAEVTAVFAQSPGPLQLLPSPEYGMGWLKIKDGGKTVSLPQQEPYGEIYTARGKWWSLCDEKLINPLDPEKKTIDQDWSRFAELIQRQVQTFHNDISGRYHANTYVFYGDDADYKTWGDVVWERQITSVLRWSGAYAKVDDMTAGLVLADPGKGEQTLRQHTGNSPMVTAFRLNGPGENGDGTVPIRSGAAPRSKVLVCVPHPEVEHEKAYQKRPQQLFTLWAITKIAQSVRHTVMAYEE